MSGGGGGSGNGGGGGPPGGGDPGMTYTAPPSQVGGGRVGERRDEQPAQVSQPTVTDYEYEASQVPTPVGPVHDARGMNVNISTPTTNQFTGRVSPVHDARGMFVDQVDTTPDKTVTQKQNLDKTDPNSGYYEGVDPGLAQASAKNEYDQSVENFYDTPDKEHFNQTQKEINTKIREAKKDDRYDVSLTEEQSEQFQKDMNEYYGTEDKKYEEYGRAGKGTVNLTFDEHWQNAPILHPALKFSPSARFLYVIGKQAQEALTSDYGTSSYAGPGTDRGGLLGQVLDQATQGVTVSKGTGAQSSNAASNFINTGKTQPTGSVAGSWYQSLGGTKAFDLATEYAAAKSNVTKRLGTPSQYGWLAVNDSPFYNWLKTNSLDKGIL